MDERAFINDVLTEAAMYIKEHYPPSQATTKAPREVVTEVDLAVEQQLRQQIMQAYPEHGIVGEELPDYQPESNYQWVIDPVDGTTNYAHSIPLFCSAIALLNNQQVIAAGVIAPVTGELWTAKRGEGAYKNAKRITTPQQELTQGIIGFCHSNDKEAITTISNYYQPLKQATRDFRRLGSANLEICMAASGELAGFIGYRIQPWDFLPGCLIAQEAGCTVTGWNNESWEQEGVESVLVASQETHLQLKELLQANT